jgi:hypothetical protein
MARSLQSPVVRSTIVITLSRPAAGSTGSGRAIATRFPSQSSVVQCAFSQTSRLSGWPALPSSKLRVIEWTAAAAPGAIASLASKPSFSRMSASPTR